MVQVTITCILIFLGIIIGLPCHEFQQICKPFRAYIFWDRSKDDNTFKIQKHFIARIIHNTPEGSEIRLYTDDITLRPVIDNVKDKTNTKKLVEAVSQVPPRNTEHEIISYKTLKKAVPEYSQEHVTTAVEFFFVVDDNSKIDDGRAAIEKLKRIKTFVVFHGKRPPSRFWTNIATDKQHLLKLNDNLDAGVDSFLNLLCQGLPLYEYQQICKPLRAYIFWDRSKDENTFDIQRHFILRIIDNTPEGSDIRLDTDDITLRTTIDNVKDKTSRKKLTETLYRVPRRNTEHQIISYKTLEETLSKEHVTTAEEVFFVIDDNSKIDDERTSIEQLKRMKIFVVVYGTRPLSRFWTSIATDKHHLIKLNDNIDAGVDSFLRLSCQDSSLHCDTNMYSTGDECRNCTNICARTPAEDPQYCRDACPYFRGREHASDKNGCNSLEPHKEWIFMFFVCMMTLMTPACL